MRVCRRVWPTSVRLSAPRRRLRPLPSARLAVEPGAALYRGRAWRRARDVEPSAVRSRAHVSGGPATARQRFLSANLARDTAGLTPLLRRRVSGACRRRRPAPRRRTPGSSLARCGAGRARPPSPPARLQGPRRSSARAPRPARGGIAPRREAVPGAGRRARPARRRAHDRIPVRGCDQLALPLAHLDEPRVAASASTRLSPRRRRGAQRSRPGRRAAASSRAGRRGDG